MRYVVTRVVLIVPILLGISAIMFGLIQIVPNDPARVWVGPEATPGQLAQARKDLGLDHPLHLRYARYLASLVRGDFGLSLYSKRPVSEDLREYLPATLELATAALLLSVVGGVALGVVSAAYKDGLLDHGGRILASLGVSMPGFWLALLLQLFMAGQLGLLPLQGRIDEVYAGELPPVLTGMYTVDSLVAGNWAALRSSLLHMIMPAFALSLGATALIARMTRSAMIEILGQDYVRTARSKGLQRRLILIRHALPNALIPVITVAGLSWGYLLGGAFAIESIFGFPGLGMYAVGSILTVDFPGIMGVTMVVTALFIIINLLVDLSYAWLDPRIRYS